MLSSAVYVCKQIPCTEYIDYQLLQTLVNQMFCICTISCCILSSIVMCTIIDNTKLCLHLDNDVMELVYFVVVWTMEDEVDKVQWTSLF
jgi:hypothetical protein